MNMFSAKNVKKPGTACALFLCATLPSISAQTNIPGSLDTTFSNGAGADGFVRVVAVQTDGKVLVGGNFNTVRGVTSPMIARLDADGKPDSGFNSPFPVSNFAPRIYTVGVQADSHILAAGSFTAVGGTFRTNIARLQANGGLDSSFNAGAGPNALVRILALQPDERIIIGGEFTSVNNTNRNRIARLNADGSLDLSFNPGTGADNVIRTVALLPTGQILVGGLFTSFDTRSRKYLVRLNSNGSLDNTFPSGTGPNNNVYFVALQADGALLISGDFTAVNGTNINRIARLQSDGSLDLSFAPNGGALGGPVYQILRQGNGKLLIGGAFTSVNGSSWNRLSRVNPDGSLDSSFNPGIGASDEVLTLALQGDGMLLAGGLFAKYDGIAVGMFARIYGDPVYPALDALLSDAGHILLSWPAWASGYGLQKAPSVSPANWEAVTNLAIPQGDRLTVTLPLNSTVQFYRLIH